MEAHHQDYPANTKHTKVTPPQLPAESKGLKLDDAETAMNTEQAIVEPLSPPMELDTFKPDKTKINQGHPLKNTRAVIKDNPS